MEITKEYIENNIGLKRQKDSNGGEYYELEGEGFFIKAENGSSWVFIPMEVVSIISDRRIFEIQYT